MITEFDELVEKAKEVNASDIHIGVGQAPCLRIDGRITPLGEEKYGPREMLDVLNKMLTGEQAKELKEVGELDMPYSIPGVARLRINVYRQRGTYAVAARLLNPSIPKPYDLGIPDSVVKCCDKRRGLILFTGPTGSGKSTSLASLIDYINSKYPYHIITFEDPVEYLHRHKKCIVHQREVGTDTHSYAAALRGALREDPDVILVGEMRDLDTISLACTAAETGHLVFSTLHTVSAVDTVNRIIDVFPPHQQQQIRTQLADILECVVAEQLLPKIEGKGRVGVFEVMLGNNAIRNYIREGKTFQITSTMQTSRAQGMITMDEALQQLYNNGQISRDTAIRFAKDKVAQEARIM
ncbi:MAG: type IV pilus twitching motility protein PilT [Lachnospiraceae bacterium]|jgi:twitching motility protein PilT|nr:type IV pilus twitching motility protein PilT [Lachnospiraceae bacterium]MDD7326319.1 type IV pilus twitching motility protein PilT [Lachnospiraceae bacterium]MDY2759778.1 type IV pilus twitching motility protein PilT [Lachnospiraceae bacterium]